MVARWRRLRQYRGREHRREFSDRAGDLPFEFMLNALRLNEGFSPRTIGGVPVWTWPP